MLDIDKGVLAFLMKVSAIIEAHSLPAYLVGGFVRDWLLHKGTDDIDIAVGGNALNVAQEVAEACGGKYVLLDEDNLVARVIVFGDEKSWNLDFASFSNSIQDDLARRDFTIDAMAFELKGFISGVGATCRSLLRRRRSKKTVG